MLFLYGQLILLVVASLEVYLVPHSHNDAGWLQNAEWYYENKCKLTLNNMLTILEENPNRKFCWAETFFLSKYLKDFPDRKKDFMKFIKEGRFELISGGWVQNDEALTDFEAVLRQMEAGFDYIKNELNITQIKVGWQVDPFGHPSLTASLWEKMGIESVTLGRIHEDVQVKDI